MLITAFFILIDKKITGSFARNLGPEALPSAPVEFETETFHPIQSWNIAASYCFLVFIIPQF